MYNAFGSYGLGYNPTAVMNSLSEVTAGISNVRIPGSRMGIRNFRPRGTTAATIQNASPTPAASPITTAVEASETAVTTSPAAVAKVKSGGMGYLPLILGLAVLVGGVFVAKKYKYI